MCAIKNTIEIVVELSILRAYGNGYNKSSIDIPGFLYIPFVFADDELSDTFFYNIIPASPEALKTLHAPATNNFVLLTQTHSSLAKKVALGLCSLYRARVLWSATAITIILKLRASVLCDKTISELEGSQCLAKQHSWCYGNAYLGNAENTY